MAMNNLIFCQKPAKMRRTYSRKSGAMRFVERDNRRQSILLRARTASMLKKYSRYVAKSNLLLIFALYKIADENLTKSNAKIL
jgi:hypothetical protein